MDEEKDFNNLNNTKSASTDDKERHTQNSEREERGGEDSNTRSNNNTSAPSDHNNHYSRDSQTAEGNAREKEKEETCVPCKGQVADNKERARRRPASIKDEPRKEKSQHANQQDSSELAGFEQVEVKEPFVTGGHSRVSQEECNSPVQELVRGVTLPHLKDSQALSKKPGLETFVLPASSDVILNLAIQSSSPQYLQGADQSQISTVTDPSTGAISKKSLWTHRPANVALPSQNPEPSTPIPTSNTHPPTETPAVSPDSQEPLNKNICEMKNNEERCVEARHTNFAVPSFFNTKDVTMVNFESPSVAPDKKCDLQETVSFDRGNVQREKAHKPERNGSGGLLNDVYDTDNSKMFTDYFDIFVNRYTQMPPGQYEIVVYPASNEPDEQDQQSPRRRGASENGNRQNNGEEGGEAAPEYPSPQQNSPPSHPNHSASQTHAESPRPSTETIRSAENGGFARHNSSRPLPSQQQLSALSAAGQNQPPPQGVNFNVRRNIQLAEATEPSPPNRGAISLRDGTVDLGDDYDRPAQGFYGVGITGADGLQIRDDNRDINEGEQVQDRRRPLTRQDRIRYLAHSFPPDHMLSPRDLLTMMNEGRMTRGQLPIIPHGTGQCRNCHNAGINAMVFPCLCYAFCTACAQQLARQTAHCPLCGTLVEFCMAMS